MSGERLLVHLGWAAKHKFGLTVWQWLPEHVGGHAPGSMHYQTFPHSTKGRAFDAYRSALRQARFARYVKRHYASSITEGIYNGRFTKLSIKNGKTVPSSYWGAATWAEHQGHVHIGV